jgi:hypothetical protein
LAQTLRLRPYYLHSIVQEFIEDLMEKLLLLLVHLHLLYVLVVGLDEVLEADKSFDVEIQVDLCE